MGTQGVQWIIVVTLNGLTHRISGEVYQEIVGEIQYPGCEDQKYTVGGSL